MTVICHCDDCEHNNNDECNIDTLEIDENGRCECRKYKIEPIGDYPDMPYQFDNMTGSMNLH